MKAKFSFTIVAAFSILIGIYPFIYYIIFQQQFGLLDLKQNFIQNSVAWKISFYAHIFLGGIALLIGWTQFVTKWRVQNFKLHRRIGKLYVFCAFVSSIAGIGIGVFATGGIISALGFTSLGFIWFCTTLKAYSSIIAGDVVRHKMWMIYSYAACFSAVTLRIWMPVLMMVFDEFLIAYRIVAWLSWIPNIIVAFLVIKKNEINTFNISKIL